METGTKCDEVLLEMSKNLQFVCQPGWLIFFLLKGFMICATLRICFLHLVQCVGPDDLSWFLPTCSDSIDFMCSLHTSVNLFFFCSVIF